MPISVLSKDDFRPRPHDAAAERLARKVPVAADIFKKLHPAAKQRAFALAQVHKARLLQQAQHIIERTLRHGRPVRDAVDEILKAFDVAGVPRPAAGRLRQSIRGNLLTAYSQARREQMDRPHIRAAFPYRQKLTVGNGTPGVNGVRPSHAALHGKVFRADDTFWDHFSGNYDYGCRCFERSLTAGQAKAMRCVIWTYVGGAIVPAAEQLTGRPGKRQRQGVRAQPNPDWAPDAVEFDLSRINAELRAALEETLRK